LPLYSYTAKTADGQTKTGTKEIASEIELAHWLRQENLFLTSAQEQELGQTTKKTPGWRRSFSFSLKHISLVEKMMFTQNLAVMIGAGLPFNRALDALGAQTKNKYFTQVIGQVNESVRKGTMLGDALAKFPKVFNELFVNMVKVGEASGSLEKVLKILAFQMKKDSELLSRVRGALIYPSVIVVAMFGIGILMMIMVVPKLSQVFKEMKTDLPLSTRTIMAVSNFLSQHWLIGLLLVLAVIIAGRFALKTKPGRHYFDWTILRLPIFGPISQKINAGRFALTLGSLIESAVPIVQGLNIVAGTLTNTCFSTSLKAAAEAVQRGLPLSQCLSPYANFYPPMVIQMIEVGEETGALGEVLKRLSDFYEEEVTNITKGLAAIIEPVLMVVIGIAVGFFAIAMLQPMYSLMESM